MPIRPDEFAKRLAVLATARAIFTLGGGFQDEERTPATDTASQQRESMNPNINRLDPKGETPTG